ncbi:MAG: LPS export ABC transporter periplasmic protein LptC [Candidatus Thiodiazotropha sp. (ex Notomyrtea botanica)]|nr:LPS export ABC transporter periplasmic protein LptC [Candidatus Thiodiazotropha sp. (ex Notomyrtea botanica)]
MKRQLLGISLTLAALLSLFWWMQKLLAPPEETRVASVETPDYYAEQLKVHTFDPGGRLQQTLETPHMEHFESTATAELNSPVLWRYDAETPPWRMQAEKALANSDKDIIFMPGEVIIDREGGGKHAPYHIVTRDLTVATRDAHTTTDAPIRIESGQQWITGIGMEGWLKAPVRLNLLSQVRGRYEFN